jgi:hypothetical protein
LIAEFEGWTYMAQIDYRASSRINTSVSFDRSVQPTIQSGAAYAVNQTLALDATYGLGSKLTLSGGLARAENRYKGVLPGQLSKEEIDIISGGARYAIGRRIALQLDLRHEERDANVAGFDYSSTQAGVTAIGKF